MELIGQVFGRLIGLLILVATALVLIKVVMWAGEGVFWGGACI